MNHTHEPAKSHNFSLAFEQMCSVVAIADTKDADETLRELILQCFAILPNEHFQNERHLADAIYALFGLQIPEYEVQLGIDRLINDARLQRIPGTDLTVPLEARARLQKSIDEARSLENKVKEGWLEEISGSFPTIPPEQAWSALRGYLARAFRRHGLQTAALLDPSLEVAPEYSESLSSLLEDTLKEVPGDGQPLLRNAITSFLAAAGRDPDRSTYIAQLADGAFNYFSLTVAPDVAEQFRKKLNSLILFLDTNFLYGILDITVNPQVAVSNDLLRAIQEYKLPFDLIYHARTLRELRTSIDNYKTYLGSRSWPMEISRAAVTSRNLFGVVVKYHQRRLETGIDVESFFRPYDHLDILLEGKNISVFNPSQDRTTERGILFNDYQDWLKQRGVDKAYHVIDHDTTVLDQVRQSRSNAKSSLDAGALLVTCDYLLYKFDWEGSRKQGRASSTVLPNLFWQILRPFIPSNSDFDRSFAETFAIPEFRTISGGSSNACAKLLYILAGYKGLPEETAARMLSNDLLINRLKSAQDDEQFQQYVEAGIVAENATLLEEKAALMQQLEHERSEKEATKGQLREERIRAERDRQARADAEKRAKEAEKSASEARVRTDTLFSIAKGLLLSTALIGIFEFIVYGTSWDWLRSHPNSYGIQASLDSILILICVGLFVRQWRKLLWSGGAIVAFLSVIFQLLGGPR